MSQGFKRCIDTSPSVPSTIKSLGEICHDCHKESNAASSEHSEKVQAQLIHTWKYRCLISRSPNLDLPPYRFELERWSHDHSLSARRQGRKGRNSQTQSLRNKAKKWNYHVQSHPSLVTIKSSRRKLVEGRRLLRFLFRKVVTWSGQSHWQTRVYSTKRKEKEKELREEAVTTNK